MFNSWNELFEIFSRFMPKMPIYKSKVTLSGTLHMFTRIKYFFIWLEFEHEVGFCFFLSLFYNKNKCMKHELSCDYNSYQDWIEFAKINSMAITCTW